MLAGLTSSLPAAAAQLPTHMNIKCRDDRSSLQDAPSAQASAAAPAHAEGLLEPLARPAEVGEV